jgi:hypothetical protein
MKNFYPDYKNLLESIRWYNLISYGNSNHEQFGSQNVILSFVKNDIAIHDQNLSALKILSKKNELNEENSLKEALFKFKEEFKPNNYNSRLYKLLNDYYDQIN